MCFKEKEVFMSCLDISFVLFPWKSWAEKLDTKDCCWLEVRIYNYKMNSCNIDKPHEIHMWKDYFLNINLNAV